MDKAKQASFVKVMGKNRVKFAKGGMVKKLANRKYYAAGGTTLAGPSTATVNQNAVNPNTGVLGSVGAALGLNNNFQAGAANTTPGTNVGQLNNAYTGAQTGLTNQNNLATSLTPQVGTAVNNQNAVAAQELAMTQGLGPNPALTQLATTTGQNVNQQAALEAGQRGASGNVGLMARNIGNVGAATQEGAAGQAATLEAQQQIAAQNNLTGLSNTQVGQAGTAVTGENTAQQNEQNILQNANTAANNNAVGMQSNINSTNAATAAANQQQSGNILGAVGSGISSAVGGFLNKGGVVGDHKEDHITLAEMNAASVAHARKNFAGGGLTTAAVPAVTNFGGQYAAPGAVPAVQISSGPAMPNPNNNTNLADAVDNSIQNYQDAKTQAATNSGVNQTLDELKATPSLQQPVLGSDSVPSFNQSLLGDQSLAPAPAALDFSMPAVGSSSGFAGGGKVCQGPYESHVANYLADGGKVPAMVSPGEIYLSPDKVQKVITEGVDPAKIGEKFKGKAKVKGDSLKNDTIPKDLEEGGVVIDRKNMSTREKRELFVHRSMAKAKVRK